MDQLKGIRTLIDRLGLPPRLARLVKEVERENGAIEEVGETPGGMEVRRVLHMVDGQNLLAALVASLLNVIEVPAEEIAADEAAQDETTPYERWLVASGAFENLVLLKIGDNYMAWDAQAERIAGEINEHLVNVDRRTCIALSESTQAAWVARIADANLDVTLAEESEEEDSGYTAITVAEMLPELEEITE